MKITGIVDRFEGELVVVELEDGSTTDYPKKMFPKSVSPGDAVYMTNGKFEIDKVKTKALKKEIDDLMDELFEK
ncbi:DUF3006 domain-containing protein [Bacillus sp. AFS017336]|uniref:DUF3006 domain-containing protein n=1 Tax=Bacillus sp. AFS017336 TaxID=2033489 RepID=UPI000BF1FA1C|nr:DUF3006 domain-containing protein [Bacillus sp. AFS017336]PEL08326.1 pyruvate kinase [Bacillus sp. AFS017336]